jgi:UTP--glucose-1-phosphate uridylyltransferase
MAQAPIVRKAVLPVAGMGTRFLPATKATPKEMLPIVDQPVIQYVVEEAVAAGLSDLLFVTGRAKRALEDHFDFNGELERTLEERNDQAKLAAVRGPAQMARIHYARQGTPSGLGHAVLCAQSHVGDENFAVLLGDEIIPSQESVLERMFAILAKHGGSVLLLKEVAELDIPRYGIASVRATLDEDIVEVVDLVEKPNVAQAPSNLAVLGRYVLNPKIFEVLRNTPPGRGGEIQLTDALGVLARGELDPAAGKVHGLIYEGERFDTGEIFGYLTTVVQLAARRADIGSDFKDWLKKFSQDL